MNLDKTKVIKALAVIVVICVGVGVLTQVSKQNSMTLQDYAEQYPEAAVKKSDGDADNMNDANAENGTANSEAGISSSQAGVANSNYGTSGSQNGTAGSNSGTSGSQNGAAGSNTGTSSSQNGAAGSKDSTASSTKSAEGAQASAFTSVLTGAQLNGESVLELRTTYTDYFYYEPLSERLRDYITGVSFPEVSPSTSSASSNMIDGAESSDSSTAETASSSETEDVLSETGTQELAISYDDLRYLHIMHYNFDGELVEGELICNKGIAQDLVEIFYELYRNEYQIEKVLLIDEYAGDDTASMEDNNTSCFNYRRVANSTSLSKHALGLAIDINPLYNPYITYNKDGSENVSPVAGMDYADRTVSFPYKIDENDLCYRLFTEHGFTWGGNWNSCKDYQHFQKVLP